MLIHRSVFCFSVLFACSTLSAQTSAWNPSPGHTQIQIWSGVPPSGAQKITGVEKATATLNDHLVAGRPWTYIENVSRPTMTIYSPKGKNTGAAVVVFPGGGYQILAIDLEGSEVCDRNTRSSMPLEDAQRTLGLLRLRAAEWHIDPHKIGVLGFSAGGHLAALLSTHFERRAYRAVDAADRQSCRPDFAVSIYPGHLSMAQNSIALNPDIRNHITRETPPTFLLQNEDDRVDRVEDALSYYWGLKKAGVPVEMHLYAQGGHAFGLRPTKFAATRWPELVETWLRSIEVLPQ